MHHAFVLPALGELSLRFYHKSTPEIVPKCASLSHVHDGYEVYILEEGESSYFIDGELYPLSVGDAVFIRPGEIHHCVRKIDSTHNHFCFHFGAEAEPFIARLSRFCAGETHISLGEYGKTSLLSLARGCENAAKAKDEILLLVLFWRLLCFLGGESYKPISLPPLAAAVKADMDTRFEEADILNALCERHAISASTLNRLSNRYFGTSPKKYIEKKRLSRATQLLKEGKSVKEAAEATGFADASTFIRLFRLRFGITPLAYTRLFDESAASQGL